MMDLVKSSAESLFPLFLKVLSSDSCEICTLINLNISRCSINLTFDIGAGRGRKGGGESSRNGFSSNCILALPDLHHYRVLQSMSNVHDDDYVGCRTQ